VAGYYDPKTQEFFSLIGSILKVKSQVMAHELTHALQDQHFNLRRFQHWPKGDSDADAGGPCFDRKETLCWR